MIIPAGWACDARTVIAFTTSNAATSSARTLVWRSMYKGSARSLSFWSTSETESLPAWMGCRRASARLLAVEPDQDRHALVVCARRPWDFEQQRGDQGRDDMAHAAYSGVRDLCPQTDADHEGCDELPHCCSFAAAGEGSDQVGIKRAEVPVEDGPKSRLFRRL